LPRGGWCLTPSGSAASSVARHRVTLVRPCGFPRDRCQDASNSVSTTDVSRHEHPSKHHLRRPSAERRGKTRQRSTSRSPRVLAFARPRKTPDHLAVIRTSDSRALDGAPPASGRSTASHRVWRGEGRALRPCQPNSRSVESSPLTPLVGRPAARLRAALCLSPELVLTGSTSTPPVLPSPRCLLPAKTARAPFRELDAERCPAGRRGQPPHAFIDVREHRLDLWTVRFRERSRGRVRSSGFCRSVSLRARLWTARAPRPPGVRSGRLRGSTELPRSRAITEKARGQGSKKTAPRRSPRRLLVTETLPQPWPFRAPPVAAIALSPCPE
jgi:hypothetical protein